MLEILSNPNWAGIAAIATIIFGVVGILFRRGKTKVTKGDQFRYEVNDLAERFLLTYKSHSIEHAQIPKYVDLSLADLGSNTQLLQALNGELLSVTCSTFGIQNEWLEGGKVPIYPQLYFDKQLGAYIDFLDRLQTEHDIIRGFAIKSFTDKLKKDGPNYDIALLFRGNINELGRGDGEPIWRYYPLGDHNFWGYKRTRLQLKAMIHIAYLFNIFISGCQMAKDEIKQIREGTIFPGPLMEDRSRVAWHPDEYTFCEIDTFQPHDIEEAKRVRENIYQDFYQQLEKCDGIDLKRLQHFSHNFKRESSARKIQRLITI